MGWVGGAMAALMIANSLPLCMQGRRGLASQIGIHISYKTLVNDILVIITYEFLSLMLLFRSKEDVDSNIFVLISY